MSECINRVYMEKQNGDVKFTVLISMDLADFFADLNDLSCWICGFQYHLPSPPMHSSVHKPCVIGYREKQWRRDFVRFRAITDDKYCYL